MKTTTTDQEKNLHKSGSNLVKEKKAFQDQKKKITVNREKWQDRLTNLNHVKIKQIPGKKKWKFKRQVDEIGAEMVWQRRMLGRVHVYIVYVCSLVFKNWDN